MCLSAKGIIVKLCCLVMFVDLIPNSVLMLDETDDVAAYCHGIDIG